MAASDRWAEEQPAQPASEIRALAPVARLGSRTNLGEPLTAFVGREALLAQLGEQLAPGCLTLIGGAGVGKTRLAVEALRRQLPALLARHRGGVWLCELAEARGQAGICAALARTLGVPLTGTAADDLAALGHALASRGATLVLFDNAEHVAAPLAQALDAWRTAGACFVVTSRRRLGLAGERVIEVPPLALHAGDASEAEELFLARARLVRHGYRPSGAERAAIAAIVCRLEGVPLAIELAASRLRVLSATQLAQQLAEHHAALLASTRAGRHGTLEEAIAWSWRLLEPAEQAALAQCSVFRGGFDLDAAHEVLELPGGPWVLDVVQSLCDHSLLDTYESDSGGLRYRLLESVRVFAAERLEDTARVERRHDAYYLSIAEAALEAAWGPGARVAHGVLAAELDNLLCVHARALAAADDDAPRRALTVAVALSPLLLARGPHHVFATLLDAGIDRARGGEVDLGLRAWAHMARAVVRGELGDVEGCRAERRRALELAQASDDARLVGRALTQLAKSAIAAGQLADAAEMTAAAIAHHEAVGTPADLGRALDVHARVLGMEGGSEKARACYRRALSLLREHGDPLSLARVLGHLGRLEHDLGCRADARERYCRALGLLEDLGDRRHSANMTLNLGNVALELGELDEAERCYRRGLELSRQIGNRRIEALGLALLSQCLELGGDTEAARRCSREALELLDGPSRIAGLAHCWRARLEADVDEIETAAHHLEAAQSLGSASLDPVRRLAAAHLELALARRAFRAGRAADARAHLARAERAIDVDAGALQTIRSSDTRMALPRLREALAGFEAPERLPEPTPSWSSLPPPPSSVSALRISRSGRTFVLPDGRRVDLSTRRAPRRILEALVARHAQAPGQALSQEDLLAAGWPGERVVAHAGASRVYTAVATLRRMGLKPYLLRHDDGYLLDPETIIERYGERY